MMIQAVRADSLKSRTTEIISFLHACTYVRTYIHRKLPNLPRKKEESFPFFSGIVYYNSFKFKQYSMMYSRGHNFFLISYIKCNDPSLAL